MKKLIVVRHSKYEGHLTPDGLAQFDRLLDQLAPQYAGSSIAIISAPSSRTQDTAKRIRSKTNSPVTVVQKLDGSGFSFISSQTWNEIIPMVMSQPADVVFAVLHREETEVMAQKVAAQIMPDKVDENERKIFKLDHGAAHIIDLEKKTVDFVRVP